MKRFMLGGAAMLILLSLALTSLAESSVSAEFILDGRAWTLPLAVSDMTADGWSISQPDEVLTPGSYTVDDRMTRNGESLKVQVINLTDNDLSKTDCLIGQILVSGDFAGSFSTNGWTIPDALPLLEESAPEEGVSTPTDIAPVRPEPFTAQGREYDKLEVSFLENGSVEQITLRSFTPSAPVQTKSRAASVSNDADFDYTIPDELGSELARCRIRLNDALYSLPLPWRACEQFGWRMTVDSSAKLAASSISELIAVKMPDGSGLSVVLYNPGATATTLNQSVVIAMSISRESGIDMQLPNQITFATSETDLVDILGDQLYAVNEDADTTQYALDFDSASGIRWYFDKLTRRMSTVAVFSIP